MSEFQQPSKRILSVIGAPLWYGEAVQGAETGPSVLRRAGLMEALSSSGREVWDAGDIKTVALLNQDSGYGCPVPYIQPLLSSLLELTEKTASCLLRQHFLLVLGGDASIALGVLAGSASLGRTAVIWISPDVAMQQLREGFCPRAASMVLAASLGFGVKEMVSFYQAKQKILAEDIYLAAVSSADASEKTLMHQLGLQPLSAQQMRQKGFKDSAEAILNQIRAKNSAEHIHICLNLAILDAGLMKDDNFDASKKLALPELLAFLEPLMQEQQICSFEIVGFAPERPSEAKMALQIAKKIAQLTH